MSSASNFFSFSPGKELDWEKMYSLAIGPQHAEEVRASRAPEDIDAYTMCGNFCALKIVNQNYNLAE
jgi:phosphomethylpyrimidine synthase